MKIQSLSSIKQNNFLVKYNNPCTQKFVQNTNKFDSFSFMGSKVEYDTIRPIRMQAHNVKQDAIELDGKSRRIAADAYEALAGAKSEYLKALSIIEIFKQDPKRDVRKLKNGNELRFEFEIKNNISHLKADECDINGEVIRTFNAVNFIPTKITTYNDGINNYEFTDKDVTIMQGMNICAPASGSVEAVYKFTLGILTSASIDLQTTDKPQTVAHMYFYDENGNLRIYTNNSETSDSYTRCDERYVLDGNGAVLNYFSGFSSDISKGTMKFDKSMHFDNGKLIAYTRNSDCDKKGEEVISKDSYYSKDGEFMHSSDFHFLMTDFEPIVFEDKE